VSIKFLPPFLNGEFEGEGVGVAVGVLLFDPVSIPGALAEGATTAAQVVAAISSFPSLDLLIECGCCEFISLKVSELLVWVG
jgi:hypothetical protein